MFLTELFYSRKDTKKKMAQAYNSGNTDEGDILNALQLAIKLSMNSVYGFLGRTRGNLILKQLASIVTMCGRKAITTSKDYTEKQFVNYLKENGKLKVPLKEYASVKSESEKSRILEKYRIL
jgi:DNA polymerase delta subunit 1